MARCISLAKVLMAKSELTLDDEHIFGTWVIIQYELI